MTDAPPDDLPEQLRIRRAKFDRLRASLYPVAVERTASLADVRAAHPNLSPDETTGEYVGVGGRVIFLRNTGKLCFAVLRENGAELQVMVALDRVGPTSLTEWKSDVDLGDLLFVYGEVVSSRRGELSVLATRWQITAKALQPLPVAHRPLSDETRMRRRYVDLIVRPEARDMVLARASVLRSLRTTLDGRGYVELETPILQTVHGGAAARPFHTHLNAFDLDMSLRIATELYLKRAIVGGFDRVYELGRSFRNEGSDSTHSPEYTQLEAYEAYGDYNSMAELTRTLILDAARALGVSEARTLDDRPVPLEQPWRTVTLHEAVSEATGEHLTPDTGVEPLRALADKRDVHGDPSWTAGQIMLELFEKLVEHTLLEPTFVRDYPVDVRPLARPHRDDPRLAEAWDLIIGGVEVAPAYSELADPVEQRRRLVEQSLAASQGDPEAMELDEDFLHALEYGMPPTGGMGLGVDRLVMLLTGKGIRDTVLFPIVKPVE